MTNIHDCIQRAVTGGHLPAAHGQAAQGIYQQLVDRYADLYPLHQAQAMAAKDLKLATRKNARKRFHTAINQLQSMRRIRGMIEQSDNPARTIRNLMEHSPDSASPTESVRYMAEAYQARVRQIMFEVLNETGMDKLGRSRNPALLRDVIRELHGQASGSPKAGQMADAVRKAQNELRIAFNDFGGDIGELADYGVHHSHDADAMMAAGYDEWATAIEGRLAWDRIEDASTGQVFSASGTVPPRAQTDAFLRPVYETITTGGWDKREPSLTTGGKALYNQRAEHRVLHFKSGDDWMDYNEMFGRADPFSAMIQGLYSMAEDVALMRVLGPNPRASLEYAHQVGTKMAKTRKDGELAQRIDRQARKAKVMLAHFDGSTSVPEYESWARFFSGVRSYLVSTQLGSAVLSSVTDEATIRMAARVLGMNPNNVLTRQVDLMASQMSKAEAARAGFVAETLADAGAGTARYFGKTFASGLPDRVANFTLRASGLNYLTDMRRVAFQMELSGHLANMADLAFDELDPKIKSAFEARGIKPADWDAFRSVKYEPRPGASFLSPLYWLEHQTTLPRTEAEGLALRLQSLFRERLELAVPTASLEGRALALGANQPGSFAGELLRSSTSYKSFSLTLMLNQIRQFQNLPAGMSKAHYAAGMSLSLIMLGALAVQMKEVSKGNDPRPMTDFKFWMAALMQGGGLGIFGDFFAAETSRAGGGLAETVAGPVVGLAGDVIRPVASNAARVMEGDAPLIGRDIANFVRFNTPVASSLWYGRVAFDRLVADQLQQFLDGDASAVWARQMRQREKDYGTTTWWDRGAVAPNRTPNLGNIMGANQ